MYFKENTFTTPISAEFQGLPVFDHIKQSKYLNGVKMIFCAEIIKFSFDRN